MRIGDRNGECFVWTYANRGHPRFLHQRFLDLSGAGPQADTETRNGVPTKKPIQGSLIQHFSSPEYPYVVTRLLDVVKDVAREQNRRTALRGSNQVEHLTAPRRIERRGRFIEE